MINFALKEAINEIWPMIILVSIVLTLIRLMYLLYNKEKFVLYKELFNLIFIIYILILFYIVTFQDNNYGASNYIPFKEISRYDINSELFFKNIIGNILLFLPFGLFSTIYIHKRKIFPIIFISLIASLAIEISQLFIGRVFDIDDIILNVVGSILGYLLYLFVYSIKNKIPNVLKKRWIVNLIVVLIFIGIILYFTNWYKYVLELIN
jgi:glycopeptide antibiotics resistance protein